MLIVGLKANLNYPLIEVPKKGSYIFMVSQNFHWAKVSNFAI